MAKESKYKSGLSKTKVSFWAKLKTLFTGKVDENFFEELEMVLVSADMSISAVSEIVENLRDYSINEGIKDTEKLKAKLKSEIVDILNENGVLEIEYPAVFMIVGVNGVGKTTTIGKLVNYFVEKKKE
ncbi:MAG: signal recognition particle receptor subunit alpha, partial [Clostridia bacterium]